MYVGIMEYLIYSVKERDRMVDEKKDFCKCQSVTAITSEEGEFGYWDICCTCGKPLEDGYHYYNHYDGEDHDDLDMYD